MSNGRVCTLLGNNTTITLYFQLSQYNKMYPNYHIVIFLFLIFLVVGVIIPRIVVGIPTKTTFKLTHHSTLKDPDNS